MSPRTGRDGPGANCLHAGQRILPFEPIDVGPQRGEQTAGHPSAAGDDRHLPGGEGLEQDGRAPLPVAALVVGKQEDVGELELVPVGVEREWSGEAFDEGVIAVRQRPKRAGNEDVGRTA